MSVSYFPFIVGAPLALKIDQLCNRALFQRMRFCSILGFDLLSKAHHELVIMPSLHKLSMVLLVKLSNTALFKLSKHHQIT